MLLSELRAEVCSLHAQLSISLYDRYQNVYGQ